jgi:hypothetical protein
MRKDHPRRARPSAVRTQTRLWLAAACLLGAVPAASARPHMPDPRGEAELGKLLAGRTAGKPTDCIDLRTADNSQVIDHTAIVYRDGGTIWVNRPRGNLDALDDNSILVTHDFAAQMCSIDPVHLIDRTTRFERGFVVFDKFVPYTKPK